jgi:hypothetical protein
VSDNQSAKIVITSFRHSQSSPSLGHDESHGGEPTPAPSFTGGQGTPPPKFPAGTGTSIAPAPEAPQPTQHLVAIPAAAAPAMPSALPPAPPVHDRIAVPIAQPGQPAPTLPTVDPQQPKAARAQELGVVPPAPPPPASSDDSRASLSYQPPAPPLTPPTNLTAAIAPPPAAVAPAAVAARPAAAGSPRVAPTPGDSRLTTWPPFETTGRWTPFEQIGLTDPGVTRVRPSVVTTAARGVVVSTYRLIGFAVLTIIVVVLLGYLATTGFYLVSKSWVQPMVVSPTDERVLELRARLVELENQRDQIESELGHLDRYIAVQRGYQQKFADAIKVDLAGRKLALRRMRKLAYRYANMRRGIGSSNSEYAAASKERLVEDFEAGLVDESDVLSQKYQLAQISSSNLSLDERQTEYENRAAELEAQADSLETLLTKKGSGVSYDALRIEHEFEQSRLEVAKALQDKTALEASLQRQLDRIRALRQSPYLRAVDENANIAFVPYANMDNVQIGTVLSSCLLEIAFCREVGRVTEVLSGEVTWKHPHREKVLRGQMVSIDVNDNAAAENDVLMVGDRWASVRAWFDGETGAAPAGAASAETSAPARAAAQDPATPAPMAHPADSAPAGLDDESATAAATGPGGGRVDAAIAAAEQAARSENWALAAEAATNALALDADSVRASELRDTARREQDNERALRRLRTAAEAETWDRVPELFAAVANDSVYYTRAQEIHDLARERYAKSVRAQAKRLASRGDCGAINKLARKAGAVWQDVSEAARSALDECRATRSRSRQRLDAEAAPSAGANEPAAADPDQLLSMSRQQYMNGNYRAAYQLCGSALELDPRDARARAQCVLAACQMGDRPRAAAHYDRLDAGKKAMALQQCRLNGVALAP